MCRNRDATTKHTMVEQKYFTWGKGASIRFGGSKIKLNIINNSEKFRGARLLLGEIRPLPP